VREPALIAALERACELAERGEGVAEAAEELGTSGYVLHTVPFAVFCFARYGDDPLPALVEAIGAGGDTDSIGAILGAWLGALHGEAGLPAHLLAAIHDGPFGHSHLRALASALYRVRSGAPGDPLPDGRGSDGPRDPAGAPGYSAAAALARNLALYPVILAHGLRRLTPW
jgi:hypothetical protein